MKKIGFVIGLSMVMSTAFASGENLQTSMANALHTTDAVPITLSTNQIAHSTWYHDDHYKHVHDKHMKHHKHYDHHTHYYKKDGVRKFVGKDGKTYCVKTYYHDHHHNKGILGSVTGVIFGDGGHHDHYHRTYHQHVVKCK